MKKLIFGFALLASLASAQVAINDTLYVNGGTWTGTISVCWPAFTTASGAVLAKSCRDTTVTSGVVAVSLFPTEGASPAVSYSAHYRTTSGPNRGVTWDETWAVASSPSIQILHDVRRSSSTQVFPSEIVATGLPTGTYCWAVVNATVTGLVACSGGSGGDVVGPASATDNAVARFNSTTGKLIQNSLLIVDDSGNAQTPGSISVGSSSAESTSSFSTSVSGPNLGSELLVNGDFASGLTGWTISGDGTGWSVVEGKLTHTPGNDNVLLQSVSVPDGTTLVFEETGMAATVGTVQYVLGHNCGSDCTNTYPAGATKARGVFGAYEGSDHASFEIKPTSDSDVAVATVSLKVSTFAPLVKATSADDSTLAMFPGSSNLILAPFISDNWKYYAPVGIQNVLLGYAVGFAHSGSFGVIAGNDAGYSNVADHVVEIGSGTGAQNEGDHLVAIGTFAALRNQGADVVAIGHSTLASKTGGDDVVAIGASDVVGSQRSVGQSVLVRGNVSNNSGLPLTNVVAINGTATESNQTVIGNSGTISTKVYGDLIADRVVGATDKPSQLLIENKSCTAATLASLIPLASQQCYCTDCQVTSSVDNTCTGSGSGAMAFRIGSDAKCLQ